MSVKSQRDAWNNGRVGENLIHNLFKAIYNTKELNSIIDFCIDYTLFIEIKTCSEYIVRTDRKDKVRKGRFKINKKQDKFLKECKGIYIFVVINKRRNYIVKCIEASKIEYKDQIMWTKIFGDEKNDL